MHIYRKRKGPFFPKWITVISTDLRSATIFEYISSYIYTLKENSWKSTSFRRKYKASVLLLVQEPNAMLLHPQDCTLRRSYRLPCMPGDSISFLILFNSFQIEYHITKGSRKHGRHTSVFHHRLTVVEQVEYLPSPRPAL